MVYFVSNRHIITKISHEPCQVAILVWFQLAAAKWSLTYICPKGEDKDLFTYAVKCLHGLVARKILHLPKPPLQAYNVPENFGYLIVLKVQIVSIVKQTRYAVYS